MIPGCTRRVSRLYASAAGRLVTVCLARDSGNVESLLRVEAKPFIAAYLKDAFNYKPHQFHPIQLHLAELFNARSELDEPLT